MPKNMKKEQLTEKIIPATAVLLGATSVYLAKKHRSLSRKNESYKNIVHKLLDHRMADLETMASYEREIEKLKKESVTDPLTGLNNRRAFDLYLKAISAGGIKPQGGRSSDTQPNEHPYSVLILDVDKFKSVNDTYNHIGGDAVLKGLAGILKGHAHREVDLPARLGGEEFALILPGANVENAAYVAELIREDAESGLADPLRQKFSGVPNITVSIGVGELDLTRPLEESLEAIDSALYYAKEHGRNQVVTVEQATGAS
jgi:diguanylate cyclase (GGDEF)-like protein